jgi:hypothetical protein
LALHAQTIRAIFGILAKKDEGFFKQSRSFVDDDAA